MPEAISAASKAMPRPDAAGCAQSTPFFHAVEVTAPAALAPGSTAHELVIAWNVISRAGALLPLSSLTR